MNQHFLSFVFTGDDLCPAVPCPWHAARSAVSRGQGVTHRVPNSPFPWLSCTSLPTHRSTGAALGGHRFPMRSSSFPEVLAGAGTPAAVFSAGTRGRAAASAGALPELRLLLLAEDWCRKANSREVFPARGALQCGTPAPLGSGLDGGMCCSACCASEGSRPGELLLGRS